MRVTSQQKITAAAIALLFLIAIGASAFINSEPDVRETRLIMLSTSTPTQVSSSTGWWDAIPTDPSLPVRRVEPVETMPGGGIQQ